MVLGDLLCGVGRNAEALPLLEDALAEASEASDAESDDLLDHELDRALRDGHGP
ncbi:hypothetical protein [Umezawaea sp. Da 62-37]|uniref:hypothetical protein n=1 Tax=Umezawaea sp. Da 62-37 TaxID=3075927 RepID=UPI0028F73BC7|nr:hypothetical protein [Umezawaea sp. Da 62-37]WNV85718.1 hypothetical protein RM788_47660 [Umezawaea sp. Da 62-37]